MCTLTVIPISDSAGRPSGYRAVMNRDEVRSRSVAHAPAHKADGGACWPTDPDGGGTWFGTTAHGLTIGVLNVNLREHEPACVAPRTRGELIPTVSTNPDAQTAASALRSLDLERYRPFRMVAIDRGAVIDLRWDRHRLIETARPMGPACFVSSGLGDHRVEPRLMLFDSIFSSRSATPELQDEYHSHVWPHHEDISVMMSREAARTTSVTTVEMLFGRDGAATATMRHSDDNGEADPVELGGLVAAAG